VHLASRVPASSRRSPPRRARPTTPWPRPRRLA